MEVIRALLMAVVLAACATPASAQGPLAPLDFLHGCWIGVFEGADARDQRCFTPMHDGRQLRDVHEVIGTGYRGETIYAWDAAARAIVVAYFASDGGYMTGVVAEEGGVLGVRDGRYVGANGQVLELRSRWLRQGDGFVTETERLVDGGWTPFMRISYTRAPEAD